MEKKKVTQIVIVVVLFLAAGIILYKTFFGGSGAVVIPAGQLPATITPASILPYGKNFDYQKIQTMEKQGFEFGQIQYPVLSTSTDVGKNASDLIAPLPETTTAP